jgi:hypothetical protein
MSSAFAAKRDGSFLPGFTVLILGLAGLYGLSATTCAAAGCRTFSFAEQRATIAGLAQPPACVIAGSDAYSA